MNQTLTIALPKGRIYKELEPIMAVADIIPEADFFDDNSRKLMFATNNPDVRIIRVRSFDVASFVAYGGAEIGISGSDVLQEFDYPDIYEPIDLNIGKCRLSIACPKNIADKQNYSSLSHIRVATKYPNLTKKYFAAKGVQAECIKLNGAMELAPMLGLSQYIVDLVSTGNTLKANGLVEIDKIMDISSRLIVARGAFKTRNAQISAIIDKFNEAISAEKT